MEKSIKLKFGFCVIISVLSFWLLTPTLWSLYNPEKDVADMPAWMPKTAMKLVLIFKAVFIWFWAWISI